MDHLRKTVTHCKYPKWAIDRVEEGSLSLPIREVVMLIPRAWLVLSPTPMK